MIKFSLYCPDGHDFEAWFRDSAAFDDQKENGEVLCPQCSSPNVEKALMAPGLGAASVGKRGGNKQPSFQPAGPGVSGNQTKEMILKLRKHVEANADYVGDKFADEARKIHFNEAEARVIYGEATIDEAVTLNEEGIDVLPLPILPEEQN